MKVCPPRSVRSIAPPCVAFLLALARSNAGAHEAPADTTAPGSQVVGRAPRDTASDRFGATVLRVRDSGPGGSLALLEQPPHRPFAPDRLQHASLSFAIGLGAGLASDRPSLGAGAAVSLGVIKELLDRRSSGFDRGDLIADLVGAGLAGLTAWRLVR